MASITLNPSAYVSLGASTGTPTISNQTNPVGKGSSNTTYAQLTTVTTANSTSYALWKFDCSSIPSDATIDSVSCVAKIGANSTSTNRSSSRSVQLYNGTSTAKGNSVSWTPTTAGTTTTISTTDAGTWTRSELDNIHISIASTRGTSTQAFRIYFYGADLTVNYTENGVKYTVTINSTGNGTTSPTGTQQVTEGDSLDITAIPDTDNTVRMLDNSMTVTNLMVGNVYTLSNIQEDHTIDVTYIETSMYDVNTTINNGTLTNPTTSERVTEGSDLVIEFIGNDNTTFKSMTVNGIAVTPTETEIIGSANYEISSNYGTYQGEYSNMDDGSNTTYWWSSEAQAAGKYVMWTFTSLVTLESFECYSSNSGDYPHSTNVLQVSEDGEAWEDVGTFSDSQTSNFLNFNKVCKYVRIYATGNTSNWLVLANVQLTYSALPTMGYSYTLSNISENKHIVISFKDVTDDYTMFFKDSDGEWKEGAKIYQKRGNCWWEITRAELIDRLNKKKFKRGEELSNHTNDPYINGRTLLFEDDFDKGELDTTVWKAETGYCRNDNCVAYYTPDALSFEGSNLVITGTKDSSLPTAKKNSSSWALTYKSGSIHSQDLWTFQYGRAQAKLKCPKLAGTWPAWWLFGNERKFAEYHTDGTILTETGVEWSECGEIDIIEQYGTSNSYEWNLWQSQAGAGSSYRNGAYTLDPSEWHVYEVEWTPTTINFMVDGDSVSGDIDITVSQGLAYRTYDFFMILNLQLGGTAGTVTDDNIKMYVDWVRIYDYERDYTITYNTTDKTMMNTHCVVSAATDSTAKTVKQGFDYRGYLFPAIGYKFSSVSIVSGGKDITADVYKPDVKEIDIDIVNDDVTITTTTVPDTEGRLYVPLQDRPSGYGVLTINENFEFSLNEYALNPGYNISSASTTVNVEFIMPDDFVFSTDEGPIVPEELDFTSGLESGSEDMFNGVINDASMIGIYPMWNITNWNDNNYFVMTFPIDVVGNNIDDIKTWFGKNNIQIYYPRSTSSTSDDE